MDKYFARQHYFLKSYKESLIFSFFLRKNCYEKFHDSFVRHLKHSPFLQKRSSSSWNFARNGFRCSCLFESQKLSEKLFYGICEQLFLKEAVISGKMFYNFPKDNKYSSTWWPPMNQICWRCIFFTHGKINFISSSFF